MYVYECVVKFRHNRLVISLSVSSSMNAMLTWWTLPPSGECPPTLTSPLQWVSSRKAVGVGAPLGDVKDIEPFLPAPSPPCFTTGNWVLSTLCLRDSSKLHFRRKSLLKTPPVECFNFKLFPFREKDPMDFLRSGLSWVCTEFKPLAFVSSLCIFSGSTVTTGVCGGLCPSRCCDCSDCLLINDILLELTLAPNACVVPSS